MSACVCIYIGPLGAYYIYTRRARVARENIEQGLGRSIISLNKASDYIRPIEDAEAKELPLDNEK